MKSEALHKAAAGPVILTENRLDANRKLCLAGMQIAPAVEGWPLHRVAQVIRQGYARVTPASQTTVTKAERPAKGERPSAAEKAEKLS